MTAPFDPAWQLKALIARHGYANAVTRELASMLQRTFSDINAKLLELDPTSPRAPEYQQFVTFLGERLAELNTTTRSTARDRVAAAGQAEAEGVRAQSNQVLLSLGMPSRNQLIAAARYTAIVDSIEVGGVGFGEWWTDTLRGALRRTKVAVQQGIVQGVNSMEIARQIYSKREGQRSIANITLAQWRTGVRTAMTAVQTRATIDELRDMQQIAPRAFSRVRLEAILDARTSDICRALDGEEFELGDPNLPQPPLHPNCRSALVPVLDTRAMGVDGSIGKRGRNYEQWLRQQPPNVQDAVLGTGKAALWRSGQVPLARMIADDRTPLTLAQLRTRLGAPVVGGTSTPPAAPAATPTANAVPIVAPTPKPARTAPKRPTAATQAAAATEAAASTVNGYTAAQQATARTRIAQLGKLTDDELEMVFLDDFDTMTAADAAKWARPPFKGDGQHVEVFVEEAGTVEQQNALAAYSRGAQRSASELPRERVPVTSLYRGQPAVERARVEYFVNNPERLNAIATTDNGSTNDMPVVVRFNKRHYLLDGHHRATAHAVLGDTEIDARVLDLDAVTVPVPKPVAPKKPTPPNSYRPAKFVREHAHELQDNPTMQELVTEYEAYTGRSLDDKIDADRHTERGQGVLYRAAKAQGFTDKPTVVDEAEFDKLAPTLKFEAFRGVSPKDGVNLAQQFIDGDYYAGYGIYGDGSYAAIARDLRKTGYTREPWDAEALARGYGLTEEGNTPPMPTVLRLALRQEARVVKHHDLMQQQLGYQRAMHTEEQDAKQQLLQRRLPTDEHYRELDRIEKRYRAKRELVMDSGTFATMLGYDAIHVTHANYLVILNRSATVVSRTLRQAYR